MTMVMTELAEKLEAMFAEAADKAVQNASENYDFEPAITDAIHNFNIEKAVESAAENYDFDSAIEDAVNDFDFSEAIEKAVDLDSEAEKAIEKAMDDLDLDSAAEEAVNRVIEEKLPSAIEKALFALLERPDVQEKLVKALFDRAAE